MKFTDYLVLALVGLAVAGVTEFVSIAAGLAFAFVGLLAFLCCFVRDAMRLLHKTMIKLIVIETTTDTIFDHLADSVAKQQIRERQQSKPEEQSDEIRNEI
jgi:hypothetical protein